MLRVWLPLTKDLRQQGLDNVTVTAKAGVTIDSNGKLGKCYNFASSSTGNLTLSSQINVSIINGASVAAWIYLNGTNSDRALFSNQSGGPVNFSFEINSSKLSVYHYNGSWLRHTGTTTLSTGKWYHIAYVCKNSKCTFYIDGVPESTIVDCPILSNYSGAIPLDCLGSRWSNGAPFAGKINDFRLYDHALSQMEVKELAKGLVLHYPLNRQGWGQENLLLNSNDLTLWPIESSGQIELQEDGYFKVSSKASNTTRYGIYYDFTFPEPDTYTFSVDVRDDWLIGVAPASTFTWTTANLSGTQGKKRISYTCTSTEENNKCRIYIAGTGTGGRVTYLKQPKLEKGSIATPWCPNSSDTLATTMGLNSITEYDCSGFCNNGTRTGTFTWTSDTLKYTVSQYFNGSNYILTDNGTFSWFDFNQLTLAGWMKPTNSPSSYSGSFGIAHNSIDGYYSKCFSISNSSSKFTINAAVGSNWLWITAPYTVPANEWHHYAATLNGTNVKMYVDGELVHSATINWDTAIVASDTKFQVGVDLPGSDETYQGYYSDVRAYATALSASDVKSLYQNSAYIDSSGNVYGTIHES